MNMTENLCQMVICCHHFLSQDCPICFEKLCNISSFDDESETTGEAQSSCIKQLTKCKHSFHASCLQAMYNSGAQVSTVVPRYKEVPRDWRNVFVITRVRYIGILSIRFTINELKNVVCNTGVFVI